MSEYPKLSKEEAMLCGLKAPRILILVGLAMTLVTTACEDDEIDRSLRIRLSAAPESIEVDGTSTITATVLNSVGAPATNITIQWGTTFARLDVQSGTTDSDGRATAILSGQGEPGTAVVLATALNRGDQGVVQVRIGLD